MGLDKYISSFKVSTLLMSVSGILLGSLLAGISAGVVPRAGASYIAIGRVDEIRALTKNAVKTMLGLEFVHMGINNESADEAARGAKLFEVLFGMTLKEGNKSIFAGDAFEFMKSKGPGRCGHIAIRTNFVDRAMDYFRRMGFAFDEQSVTYDEKTGKPKFVYFKDEICGFAIHLLKK